MQPEVLHAEFAARLRNARETVGLTQREMASMAGVNHSQVSRYEAGIAMPRPGVLMRLANAVGVTLEHLRDGGDPGVTVEVLASEGDELLARFAISTEMANLIDYAAGELGISVSEMLKKSILAGADIIAARPPTKRKR